MEVETDSGECVGVNTGVYVILKVRTQPLPGAAEILKFSSQGDQDLKFTLKFQVMPHLDHYDPIGVL